jgi:hypothetical protein
VLHGVKIAARGYPFWFGLFLVLIFIASRLPGSWKWLPYIAALFVGIVAVGLFMKDLDGLLERGMQLLHDVETRVSNWLHPHAKGWSRLMVLIAGIVIAVTIWRAWPSWHFLMTSSLREDEILNIEQYTSRGFSRAVSSYSLARNHIFYNVMSSFLPGSDSTWPLRARFISLVSVLAGLGLLIGYAWRRGWLIWGIFAAGLLAVNHFALKTLLEARGYGFIFLCGMVASLAFAEWVRVGRRRWLYLLAIATVLGSYTLPYFVVFGAVLLILAWISKPSRTSFGAGVLAVLALAMLYLPIAVDVAKVAIGYGEEYANRSTDNFSNIESVVRIFQFLVPYPVWTMPAAAAGGLLAGAVAFVAGAKFSPAWNRRSVGAVTSAILAVAAFFLLIQSVPSRTAAFLGGALAFVMVSVGGGLLDMRPLRSVRPLLEIALAGVALAVIANSSVGEALLPRQDWRNVAKFLERSFPEATEIWAPKSYGRLIKWNLADRRTPVSVPIDATAVAEGRIVVVDGEFNTWAEARRPSRNDLPPDVRFVTFPLLINYHRVYFVPPKESQIDSLTLNGEPVPVSVSGVQIPDPEVLEQSSGHGDTLQKQALMDGTIPVEPRMFALPVTLNIRPHPTKQRSSCNLLFNRSIQNLDIRAFRENPKGQWLLITKIFQVGEFVSFEFPGEDSRNVRVEISGSPSREVGLLAAWVFSEES